MASSNGEVAFGFPDAGALTVPVVAVVGCWISL
jgi:hypothetical protein